jgi:23S rRNA pseudouridine955/2504/2580 synthase
VVFEDDALLAVAKPQGMSVHGGAGETGPTLIDLLRAAYAEPNALHLAHRLDRPTSGLVLLAKSGALAGQLAKSWEHADKRYLAIALGELAGEQRIEAPLEDKHGQTKRAETRVRPLATLRAIEPVTTLIEVALETGRTHQIRLHLAELGHPLLLDDKHGDFRANKRWIRAVRDAGGPRPKDLMLHSARLAIDHPLHGGRVRLSAEPPESWSAIVRAAGGEVDAIHDLP